MRRSHALIKAYQVESEWMGSIQVRAFSWSADPALSRNMQRPVHCCVSLCEDLLLECCLCLILWCVVGALHTTWCVLSVFGCVFSGNILTLSSIFLGNSFWLLKSLWHFPIWLPPELSAVFGVGLHLHCLGLRVSSSRRNDLLVALFCI